MFKMVYSLTLVLVFVLLALVVVLFVFLVLYLLLIFFSFKGVNISVGNCILPSSQGMRFKPWLFKNFLKQIKKKKIFLLSILKLVRENEHQVQSEDF